MKHSLRIIWVVFLLIFLVAWNGLWLVVSRTRWPNANTMQAIVVQSLSLYSFQALLLYCIFGRNVVIGKKELAPSWRRVSRLYYFVLSCSSTMAAFVVSEISPVSILTGILGGIMVCLCIGEVIGRLRWHRFLAFAFGTLCLLFFLQIPYATGGMSVYCLLYVGTGAVLSIGASGSGTQLESSGCNTKKGSGSN